MVNDERPLVAINDRPCGRSCRRAARLVGANSTSATAAAGHKSGRRNWTPRRRLRSNRGWPKAWLKIATPALDNAGKLKKAVSPACQGHWGSMRANSSCVRCHEEMCRSRTERVPRSRRAKVRVSTPLSREFQTSQLESRPASPGPACADKVCCGRFLFGSRWSPAGVCFAAINANAEGACANRDLRARAQRARWPGTRTNCSVSRAGRDAGRVRRSGRC